MNQELFLVEFEDVYIAPSCDLASKEPLGVATVGNCEFNVELSCGSVGCQDRVSSEEDVIYTGGGDRDVFTVDVSIYTPIRVATFVV